MKSVISGQLCYHSDDPISYLIFFHIYVCIVNVGQRVLLFMIAPVFPADASFLPRRHAMAPWNPKNPTVEIEMKIRYIEKTGCLGKPSFVSGCL